MDITSFVRTEQAKAGFTFGMYVRAFYQGIYKWDESVLKSCVKACRETDTEFAKYYPNYKSLEYKFMFATKKLLDGRIECHAYVRNPSNTSCYAQVTFIQLEKI